MRRLKNIKNTFSPINRLPLETLAHTATFFANERALINATTVCQHWRTTLLSFPLLWCNASGSSSKIQAYTKRSKLSALHVDLSDPSLVGLIIPHLGRLVALTVWLSRPSSLGELTRRLRQPIPTLHTFRIALQGYHDVPRPKFSSDLKDPFFLYIRRLELEGVMALDGCNLPYVTELVLRANPVDHNNRLLSTLEQFPSLEKVHISLHHEIYSISLRRDVRTLSRVQEMSLLMRDTTSYPSEFPQVLRHLRLPILTSLCVQAAWEVTSYHPIFPAEAFCDHLPNFAELPELQVHKGNSTPELTFRSTSKATLKYLPGISLDYDRIERKIWGGLPLDSVRRMTMNMVLRPSSREFLWCTRLLRDLKYLDHLELRGECGDMILWLCREITKGTRSLPIQTLTVRCGEPKRHQGLKLKCLADAAGLTMTLVCASDPAAHEGEVGMDPGDSDNESGEDASSE